MCITHLSSSSLPISCYLPVFTILKTIINLQISTSLCVTGIAFRCSTPSMKLPCFCFFAFLLMCFLLPLARSGDLSSDAEALLAFKEKTGNTDNKNLSSWITSNISSICTSWSGVTCNNDSSAQRVTMLQLPGQSLSGQIPPNILGQLDALQNLSLGSNQFYGELPSDLANCTSLRRLLLQNNNFSGPISGSAFNAWPSIMQVDLSFNNFNGSIPQSITNATLLQTLNLQNNSFSGSIPPITTSSLESFNVANNDLDGSIPSSLSGFSATSFAGNDGLCGKPLQNTCVSPPSSPPINSTTASKRNTLSVGEIAGIVIGSVGGAGLLLMLFALISKKKRTKTPSARVFNIERVQRLDGNVQQGRTREAQEEEAIAIGEEKLVFVDNSNREAFDIEGLLRASAEVMGKGSLGVAYKAMLENDLVVVVKRLNFEYKADYKTRLDVLGKLKHPNLLPIKAWYFCKDEKFLVYDYMHGTLYSHLYCDGKPMEWEARLRVASTVANALAHMHAQNVVHGNIKASNVLMDADGEAYVTDYGLAPLAVHMAVKNTGYTGYTPPEVMDLSRMTAKGDVYSFGVLLLELLTGRSPLPGGGRHNGAVIIDLPVWVQSVVTEQWTAEVFDLEIMKFEYIQEEMMLLLQIALHCVSPSPDQRPSMPSLLTSIDALRSSDDEASLPPNS